MKILVTGGTGFIGSNIAEQLSRDGHDVVILDNFSLGKMNNVSDISDKIKVISGDIRDASVVDEAAQGCGCIFNEAAASSAPMFEKNLRDAISVNVDGFINVLNAARKNDARVVYASTSSIYGNIPGRLREDMKVVPPNFYSATKMMNEHLAALFFQQYGLKSIGLRYMSVYGPREESKGIYANLVSQFIWAMRKGESPVLYGDGTQTRDFVFVADVVQANILAMNSNIGCDVFNVGTGTAASLNDMIAIINTELGTQIKPVYVENKVKNYIATQLADISKIKGALGFMPKFTLRDGIRVLVKGN